MVGSILSHGGQSSLVGARGGSGVNLRAGERLSSFVGPDVHGCRLCGRSGLFWVMVDSRCLWVAVVSIYHRW